MYIFTYLLIYYLFIIYEAGRVAVSVERLCKDRRLGSFFGLCTDREVQGPCWAEDLEEICQGLLAIYATDQQAGMDAARH